MTTATQILTVARSQIGYREGANDWTKYGQWYGMNNVAWCAMFVSWVAYHTPGGSKIIPKHAYTPAGADWFKSRGQWYSRPRVGDLVYFNFPGDGVNRISHVGLVEKVNSDGSITTIEGNTDATGSRTGGGVWRKVRYSGMVGYGRPKYAAATYVAPKYPLPYSQDYASQRHYFGLREGGELDRAGRIHDGVSLRDANYRAVIGDYEQMLGFPVRSGRIRRDFQRAVLSVQERNGLTQDPEGRIGPQTHAFLYKNRHGLIRR